MINWEDNSPASFKSHIKGIEGTLNLIGYLLMGILLILLVIAFG
jgi:hypothetical protein